MIELNRRVVSYGLVLGMNKTVSDVNIGHSNPTEKD